MARNNNLHASRVGKEDEFYTQLGMIENELKHFKPHFRGKVVLCNCDDPYESNFFKYFAMNFNSLGLKRLIATCYGGSMIAGDEIPYYQNAGGQISFIPLPGYEHVSKKIAYCVQINSVSDENGDGRVDLADVEHLIKNKANTLTLLEGDGDFRSAECIALLKEADVIVTNPTFSLFREYIAQLIEYKKKFLIIGRNSAVTYKEVWPLFYNKAVWMGKSSGHFWFRVPDSYEEKKTDFKIDKDGIKWRRMGNVCWFTNLDFPERHEDLILYKTYNPIDYPKYDDSDAIEVNGAANIPCDYDGIMGVNVDFLSKWNPDQFEIIGLDTDDPDKWVGHGPAVNGKVKFRRVFIKRTNRRDQP